MVAGDVDHSSVETDLNQFHQRLVAGLVGGAGTVGALGCFRVVFVLDNVCPFAPA